MSARHTDSQGQESADQSYESASCDHLASDVLLQIFARLSALPAAIFGLACTSTLTIARTITWSPHTVRLGWNGRNWKMADFSARANLRCNVRRLIRQIQKHLQSYAELMRSGASIAHIAKAGMLMFGAQKCELCCCLQRQPWALSNYLQLYGSIIGFPMARRPFQARAAWMAFQCFHWLL